MKCSYPIILVLITVLVFFSGCTSNSTEITPETTTPVITATEIPVPTEGQYIVTEPVLIIGEDIYSTKITVNANDSGSNTLNVVVKFDSSNPMGATGTGMVLMSTIFAYNYDDVSPSFNPQTKDDVMDAGIPYKNVATTLYPNNVKNAIAELPTDSTQGSLSLDKPYNYGAIITLQDTRN